MEKGQRIPLRLVAICLLVVALVLIPVGVIVGLAVTADWHEVSASLAGTDLPGLIGHTLEVAVVVTPLCGAFGVATAWLVERTDVPFAKVWALLVVAPIAIPLFITSYAWAGLGPNFQGFWGAAGIVAFSYYPIVFLLASAALRGMDPAQEESAKALGCSTWRVFWRVVFPQLRPALLGGLLIVALDTLVEFDAFVGIHQSFFITNIYDQYRISISISGAAALSTVSAALCVVILLAERLIRGKRSYVGVNQLARRSALRYELRAWKVLAMAAMTAFVTVAVGIPVAEVAGWLAQTGPHAFDAAPVQPGDLFAASITSLLLGLGGAGMAVLLALPIAFFAERSRSAVSELLERATYLSFALPDFVAAIALAWVVAQLGGDFAGNVAVLIFAYGILFCPIAVLTLRVAFAQIDKRTEDAGRSLGMGPLRTFWRVTLPLARPAIGAALVLTFAFVLSDLSTTQVLIPPGMVTLGTEFDKAASAVAFGAAAPYAAVLVILALGATYVLMSRFGRTRFAVQ